MQRRLILTLDDDAIVEAICPSLLSGHCYVRRIKTGDTDAIEDWIKHDDHFFTNSKVNSKGKRKPERLGLGEFATCPKCSKERDAQLKDKQDFLESSEKLVGLELFAGAGGLGYGMALSGYVDTRYAVEFMPSAAKTFK